MIRLLKIVLSLLLGVASGCFLLQFLAMFFILAIRGVYLSETAGVFLLAMIGAVLTKWTLQSALRKGASEQLAHTAEEMIPTRETAGAAVPREMHHGTGVFAAMLLAGLCLGGLGAAYGAYLHFHPECKEKLIQWTLSLPHPDNYGYLASAQAVRYMGLWEITARKAVLPGLAGALAAGFVMLIHVRARCGAARKEFPAAKWSLMGLAILLAAALLFRAGTGSGMVYYEGRHQFYWCEQLESENESQRWRAIQAACSLLQGKPFVCRFRMITALAACGDSARASIPVLEKLLRDQESVIRAKAAWALTKIDSQGKAALASAVATLMDLLHDENVRARLVAAEALGAMGPECNAAAFCALKKLARHEEPEIRIATVELLKDMGAEGEELAIETALDLLKHDREPIRYDALQMLGQMGPKAERAIPAIERLLDDEQQEWLRWSAAEVLKRIRGYEKQAGDQ